MQNDSNSRSIPGRIINSFLVFDVDHTHNGRAFYSIQCQKCGFVAVRPLFRIKELPCPDCVRKEFLNSGRATPEWAKALGFDETFWSRFWPKIDKNGPVPASNPELGPCWIWTAGVTSKGYGSLGANLANGKHVMIATHRASWMLHTRQPLADSDWLLHHCDTPRCCNPAHLYLGTAQSNSDDMVRRKRDRHPSCEHHPNAILTNEQVLEIRRMYATGRFTQAEIGACFGCAANHIAMIVRRDSWKHLP